MVKDFLEYFNKPYEIESKMKTPDGNKASFFKAYLDGCTFIVYATIVDRSVDDDGDPIFYDIVGIGNEENKRSVFFLNETTERLFTQKDLVELYNVSGSPLLDFADIKEFIRKAVDGSAPDTYIHEIPDAESLSIGKSFTLEKDFEKYAFSKHPEEDIIQDVVDALEDYSHAVKFDGSISVNKVPVRGAWANTIVDFFLTSIFHPEFPYFNLKDEKDSYVSEILKLIKMAGEDKTSLEFKYHTIPDAIQGHDTVTIDFLDDQKNPKTITVKSVAFESIKAMYDQGEKDIFMPITYEVSDTNSFLTLEMAYPDYSENIYPRLWFPWGSILCIRSGNQILWHFSEAMSEDPEDLEFHPIMRFDPVGEDYDF